jgi:hypothetical protein
MRAKRKNANSFFKFPEPFSSSFVAGVLWSRGRASSSCVWGKGRERGRERGSVVVNE